jgi:uroporphyrin-III C-methyltransferase
MRTGTRLILVGAGPGDPDLLTIKAVKALAEADVVLYDALVHPDVLNWCRECTLKVFVGKRAGRHSYRQEEINQLILRYVCSHGTVVRLKGGDPFVFGRGFEELLFARAHGIEVQVIPGISSAIAVPAMQDIPLTHRGISESFWVITGTTRSGGLSTDVHLAAQSSATVVILMGMRKLPEIMRCFADAGKGSTAAAIIRNGSLPDEAICTAPVDKLAEVAMEQGMSSPAIIIVGDVVQARNYIHKAKNNNPEYQRHHVAQEA